MLVIISLIVGGVIGGKSLIESSQINRVIQEVASHQSILRAFELQYDALPGDFNEATQFWPDDSQYPGFSTYDGNGNGRVLAWGDGLHMSQHMALSELLPGDKRSYSDCGGAWIIPCTVFKSKWKGAAYGFNTGEWSASAEYSNDAHHYLRFGAPVSNVGTAVSYFQGGVMMARHAKSIDNKLDDGMPYAGKLHAIAGTGYNNPSCRDGWTATSAVYNVSDSTPSCSLLFRY